MQVSELDLLRAWFSRGVFLFAGRRVRFHINGKRYKTLNVAEDDSWKNRRHMLTPTFSANKLRLVCVCVCVCVCACACARVCLCACVSMFVTSTRWWHGGQEVTGKDGRLAQKLRNSSWQVHKHTGRTWSWWCSSPSAADTVLLRVQPRYHRSQAIFRSVGPPPVNTTLPPHP